MRRFVIPMLMLPAFVGCDRPQDAPTPATQAAAAEPAVPEPASRPVAVPIAMRIDDRRVEFPSAKLRVGKSDGTLVALLYTDDPKDALKDQYAGNSFYFQMQLPADEVKDFADSDWRFKSESNEPTDTPYGIFLDGHRKQLQPVDVAVTFEAAGGDQTLVSISGKFLLISVDDASQPPRLVQLLAEFTATTVLKSS